MCTCGLVKSLFSYYLVIIKSAACNKCLLKEEMERWAGRVALVTGASSGIGAAITVALAQKGMIVIGVARNKDKVEVSE